MEVDLDSTIPRDFFQKIPQLFGVAKPRLRRVAERGPVKFAAQLMPRGPFGVSLWDIGGRGKAGAASAGCARIDEAPALAIEQGAT